MALEARATQKNRGVSMNDRRRQLLELIDEINRKQGHGANYRDL